MESLYTNLATFLLILNEYWPILLLVILTMRFRTLVLLSLSMSTLLTLVVFGRIQLLFFFISWLLSYILMWYEYDVSKKDGVNNGK